MCDKFHVHHYDLSRDDYDNDFRDWSFFFSLELPWIEQDDSFF